MGYKAKAPDRERFACRESFASTPPLCRPPQENSRNTSGTNHPCLAFIIPKYTCSQQAFQIPGILIRPLFLIFLNLRKELAPGLDMSLWIAQSKWQVHMVQ